MNPKTLGLSLLLVACSTTSRAQVGPDGVWKFPTSARTYCLNLEQGLIAQYKALIETNRKTIDGGNGQDQRQLLQMAEAHKAAILEYEQSWQRMSCASILYPQK